MRNFLNFKTTTFQGKAAVALVRAGDSELIQIGFFLEVGRNSNGIINAFNNVAYEFTL